MTTTAMPLNGPSGLPRTTWQLDGGSSVDDAFPLHLWDKTIPHGELTLNLLRGSRINPKLSACLGANPWQV
jgi:hypothetical protein